MLGKFRPKRLRTNDFSDVKILQDRLSSTQNGSITAVHNHYVPADDLSDPAVQMIPARTRFCYV